MRWLKIYQRLHELNPLEFLELCGFGHGYSVNITEASNILTELGWKIDGTIAEGIALLQEHFGVRDE